MFYKYLDAAIGAYTSPEFRRLQQDRTNNMRGGDLGFVPVFILGLPRSGSSLLEQILGVHERVLAAGELMHFDNLVALPSTCTREGCYMNMSVLQDESLIQVKRRAYSEAIYSSLNKQSQRLGTTGTYYVIDKLPMNWRHVPLINMVFPEAKVLYCTRSHLDVALSNYFIDYKIPYNHWSHELETIAYKIDRHEEAKANWIEVGCQWFEVNYESLIQHREHLISRVFDYIGIETHDAALCLKRFHNSSRQVYTASQHQVKTALYSRSLQRWRRFAAFVKQSTLAKYIIGYSHQRG